MLQEIDSTTSTHNDLTEKSNITVIVCWEFYMAEMQTLKCPRINDQTQERIDSVYVNSNSKDVRLSFSNQ